MSNKQISKFIDRLATAETAEDAFNQYAYGKQNNEIRRENLERYLETMHARKPSFMLVMEAPGYRGCRLTGVSVTSRKVLLEGVPELHLFGEDQGFQNVTDAGFEKVYGEQSATIVWTTLADLNVAPLIWNTFPFHPHKLGLPLTNRKPRKPETRLGGEFLLELMQIFQIEIIIAIGNVAHETLSEIGIHAEKVRHPAQGGKNDFVTGLTKIIRDNR